MLYGFFNQYFGDDPYISKDKSFVIYPIPVIVKVYDVSAVMVEKFPFAMADDTLAARLVVLIVTFSAIMMKYLTITLPDSNLYTLTPSAPVTLEVMTGPSSSFIVFCALRNAALPGTAISAVKLRLVTFIAA